MALDAVKKAKGKKKKRFVVEPPVPKFVKPGRKGIPPKKSVPTGGLPRAADARKKT